MANIADNLLPRPKRRVRRYPHGKPRNPQKVLEIARLKEKEDLKWRQIGPRVQMTAQGACMLYRKWRQWVKENNDGSAATCR